MVIIVVMFGYFFIICKDVFTCKIMNYDVIGYGMISKYLISDTLTPFVKWITWFGSATALILITLFIIIKNKQVGFLVGCNLIIITILNQVLKLIIQRPRLDEYRIIDASGYSFPSGHSMISMAFYGFIIYLICKYVNNKILKYSTTNRDGYREYKSNPSDCKSCEHLNICTNSKNKQKLVTRHIWQNYLEEADHLRHKPYVKKVYSKRKETIERVFADAKEKHGMRYTKLRGLSKIEMEVSLIFSCMNLKKLANWMWKDTSNNLRLTPIFSILSLKIFIKKKIAILYKLKMAILSTI